MAYVFAAVVLGLLIFVAWLWAAARKAGATTEQAKVATKTVDVLVAQDKAAAKAPRDRAGVTESLSKGTF